MARQCVLPGVGGGGDLTGPLETLPAGVGSGSQYILKQIPPKAQEGQKARPSPSSRPNLLDPFDDLRFPTCKLG